ncbi:MAG: YfaZ family outer membrane protein [Ectothiorhodospiraceae bacterium]|jgi:hypothetical protein
MQKFLWAIPFLFALTQVASADELEASFANDYGEIMYTRDAAAVGQPGDQLRFGALVNESNNIIAHGTYQTDVLDQIREVQLNVGGRIYFAGLTEPDDDVVGLAFGAGARIRLPLDAIPLYLGTGIFYAPAVITSGAGQRIIDVNVVRGEIGLTERMYGYVGYRRLNIDRNAGEDDIVKSLYVGARFLF